MHQNYRGVGLGKTLSLLILICLAEVAFSEQKLKTDIWGIQQQVLPSPDKEYLAIPTTHVQVIIPPYSNFHTIYDYSVLGTGSRFCTWRQNFEKSTPRTHYYGKLKEKLIDVEFIDALYLENKSEVYALRSDNVVDIYPTPQNISVSSQMKVGKSLTAQIGCGLYSICKILTRKQNNADVLYLFTEKSLSLLTISWDDKVMRKVPVAFKGVQPFQRGIEKVHIHNNNIYLLERSKVIEVDSKGNAKVIYQTANTSQLVGMDLWGNNMVLLDREYGMVFISDLTDLSVIKTEVQFSYAFTDIKIQNNTILIALKLHNKDYVAEVYLTRDHSDPKKVDFKLNRYYDKFLRFSQMSFLGRYGVLASQNRVLFFEHSINRHASMSNYFSPQGLYSDFREFILRVTPLNRKAAQESYESLLMVQYNQFQFLEVGSNLNARELVCRSMEQYGNESLEVNYRGTCATPNEQNHLTLQDASPTLAFCNQTLHYDLSFQPVDFEVVRMQEQQHYYIWAIILFCAVVFIPLYCLCYKNLVKYRALIRNKIVNARQKRLQAQLKEGPFEATDHKFKE